MQEKIKCWEFFECNVMECPAYMSKELWCWLISGTHCRDEIQGKFLEKIEMCIECEPLQANLDVASVEETLKAMTEQFAEFKGIVQERDRELESISMELALGLSEVFEALKQISSGDPLVRILETSELELIAKLKHLVNLTAENLGEIVDLSHEFAIGLAEHFDVLHRVSEGDLSARVFGTSQVELLEFLKHVTNQMIESVSREITERKRAEEALRRREADLELMTIEVAEVNTALRVLLKQREQDVAHLEESVLMNVRELVVPYTERLRQSLSDSKRMVYLNILESNLNDIISPFPRKLSSKYASLTPAEIQMAHLIKDGRTTKEIAELLNLSYRTIESHRHSIRTKLGIKNKKANLRVHLSSI